MFLLAGKIQWLTKNRIDLLFKMRHYTQLILYLSLTIQAPSTVYQPKTRNMDILVVDDDKFFQNVISKQLQDLGHSISVVSNGGEALKIIESGKAFDMILVDVNMPVLTGPSLILSLKRVYSKKLPVIVIVSGSKDGEAFMKKLEIPFDHYFEKPIDMGLFSKILSDHNHP